VRVGECAAWGKIRAASVRRAERVWGAEGWERRVVSREVKEVVRVWVAGGRED
jgi:Ni,Fe-hydrogenase I small subunit